MNGGNGGGSPESIKQIIQKMTASGDGSVIEATVIGVNPLKVQATNDAKLILNAVSLVVPRHLTDYTTKATYSLGEGKIDSVTEGNGSHGGHLSGSGTHNHHLVTFTLAEGTITVHNALKVDEVVYLLRYNDGKKYYILDRRG